LDKNERRREIEYAAFQVLEVVGFKKTSMLQIAKRANASNETLYSWYGSKQKLFSGIIEDNANAVKQALESAIEDVGDVHTTLVQLGECILMFTATEKAVVMNRAAVTDVTDSGVLAQSIEKNARQVILKLIVKLMQRLRELDLNPSDVKPVEAAEIYISLLLGELQMQQALGSVAPLTPRLIRSRAKRAALMFERCLQSSI